MKYNICYEISSRDFSNTDKATPLTPMTPMGAPVRGSKVLRRVADLEAKISHIEAHLHLHH